MSELCSEKTKQWKPCGLAAVRNGRCLYHQPEEMTTRLLEKLNRNERARACIVEELQRVQRLIPNK